MREFKFPLPPLETQQTIVSKIEELFSELDKGIEDLKTAQQQLKTYRQSVLKWAFEGKLTNEKVKEGELPEGWEWVKISDISRVVRGGSPRPAGDPKFYDGDIPFLKVADLTKDNGIYLTTFKYTIKEAGLHKTRQITPNTLLLSNSGATLGVPKICMINATMNDGVAAFLDLDERSNHYLYYFWVSKTSELRGINMGAGQPNLNTDLIKDYKVPYCSFEEQHRIVQEIESRLSVADKMEESIAQSLQQAEALRQSILKKAFSGELV
jgi:type I restriction enzyme S subunit